MRTPTAKFLCLRVTEVVQSNVWYENEYKGSYAHLWKSRPNQVSTFVSAFVAHMQTPSKVDFLRAGPQHFLGDLDITLGVFEGGVPE
jgi:hypothetical protein